MSYLAGTTYLGETIQAPMQLPTELSLALAEAEQSTETITLPGGIVMNKKTAMILALVALGFALYYMSKNKNKKRRG
jgi:hypothetical protein